MSPIYNTVSKLVERKGMSGVLDDLNNPQSPLRRGLKKIHTGYRVEGTPLSPVGQAIREVVTTPAAVKAVTVFEGVRQTVEKRMRLKLPSLDEIARTITYFASGVFGTEAGNPSISVEPEEETVFDLSKLIDSEENPKYNPYYEEDPRSSALLENFFYGLTDEQFEALNSGDPKFSAGLYESLGEIIEKKYPDNPQNN